MPLEPEEPSADVDFYRGINSDLSFLLGEAVEREPQELARPTVRSMTEDDMYTEAQWIPVEDGDCQGVLQRIQKKCEQGKISCELNFGLPQILLKFEPQEKGIFSKQLKTRIKIQINFLKLAEKAFALQIIRLEGDKAEFLEKVRVITKMI